MAKNNKMLPIPSLDVSIAVLALLGLITAIVTFVWVFKFEVDELRLANQETKFDQMNLREYAKEIAETVRLNTIAIKANGEQIKELSLKVDGIESDIKYIKCKIDNNFSETDCTELLDNQ